MSAVPARPPVTVRPATPQDAEALFAVHRDSVSALCAGTYSPQQIAMWLEGRSPATYLEALGRGEIQVAVRQGQVVGFVEAIPGEIVKLFVRGDAAGAGVGDRLMAVGLQAARHGHSGPIRIESTRNAEPFYARHGFRKVGEGVFSRGGASVAIEIVHLERA